MAEFAAAGTAVSFVSLGISVCQGLISYLDDFKSYNREVPGTLQQLESIEHTLKVLDTVACGPGSSPQIREIVATHIAICSSGIQELRTFWEKHCFVPSDTSANVLRTQKTRMLFPFHKSTWSKLKQALNTLQIGLITALQAAQFEAFAEVRGLMINTRLLQEDAVVEASDVTSGSVDKAKDGQNIKDDTCKFLRELTLVRRSDDTPNRSASCTCMRSPTIRQKYGNMIYAPTILVKSSRRCPLHPFKPIETAVLVHVPIVNRFLNYSFQLGLSIKTYVSSFSLTPELRAVRRVSNNAVAFEMISDLVFQMDEDHFSFRDKRRVSPAPGEMVERLRQNIYNVLRTGEAYPTDVDEDGNTIHTAILDTSCGIFGILSASELPILVHALVELVDYGVPINYCSGYYEWTAFDHFLVALCGCDNRYTASDWRETMMDSMARLVNKGAIATMPRSQMSDCTEHFPNSLACLRRFEQLTEVWELGPLSQAILEKSKAAVARLPSTGTDCMQERTVMGQTPCHLAVDWPCGLRLLLEAGCNADLPDSRDKPPVHYASEAGNHEILRILLDSDIVLPSATEDKIGLNHAMRHLPCWDITVFKIFIDSLIDRRRKLLELAMSQSRVVLPSALIPRSGNLLDAQAACMCAFLTQNGVSIPRALQVPHSWTSIYHYAAWNTAVRLDYHYDSGFRDIDERDDNGQAPRAVHLDYLYDSGFRNIDEPDDKGQTPLEVIALISQTFRYHSLLWLVKKGAHLGAILKWHNDRWPKPLLHPLLHVIAWAMAEWISDGVMARMARWEQLRIFSETPIIPHEPHDAEWWMNLVAEGNEAVIYAGPKTSALLKLCLTSEPRDSCVCSCFLDGCTPAFTVLKRLYDPKFDTLSIPTGYCLAFDVHFHAAFGLDIDACGRAHIEETFKRLCEKRPRKVVRAISSFLGRSQQQLQWSLSVVRFETFTRLQLRHTCCWIKADQYHGPMNPEDIEYAREEDEERLTLLEDLVEEFEAKFRELQSDNYDAIDFLEDYWATRMDEALAESPADPDSIQKIEDIGVVLEKHPGDQSKETCKDFEDDWRRCRFYRRSLR